MKLGYKTSDFSPRFRHPTSYFKLLYEELVKLLVHRCKKIDEQLKDDRK